MNTLESIVAVVVPAVAAVVITASDAEAVERKPREPIKHITHKKITVKTNVTPSQPTAPSDTTEQHYAVKNEDVLWLLLKDCNPSLPDTTIARYVNDLYDIQNLHSTYKPNFKVDNRSFVPTKQGKDSLTHNPDKILMDQLFPNDTISYTVDQLKRKKFDEKTIACLTGYSRPQSNGAYTLNLEFLYEKIDEIVDRLNEQGVSLDNAFSSIDYLLRLQQNTDKTLSTLGEKDRDFELRQKEFDDSLKIWGIRFNKLADKHKYPTFRVGAGAAYKSNEGFSPVISLGTRLGKPNSQTWLDLSINGGADQNSLVQDSIVYDGGVTIKDEDTQTKILRLSLALEQRFAKGHLGIMAGPALELGFETKSLATRQGTEDMYGNRKWKSDRLPDQSSTYAKGLFNYGAGFRIGNIDVRASQTVGKGRKPTLNVNAGYIFKH